MNGRKRRKGTRSGRKRDCTSSRNKKTLMVRPQEILLGADRFICDGVEYHYSCVRSIRYYAVETAHYANFIPTGRTTYNAKIDIYVEGQENPIKVRPVGPIADALLIGHSKEKANRVADIYPQLAERTFKFRQERYLKMLEQYGCFLYDDKRFFPDGRVTDGKQIINFRVATVYRSPFRVFVRMPKSIGKKLMHKFIKDQDFVVRTEYDADVFFALLSRLYGLRWK
jgi:hypothetical protein